MNENKDNRTGPEFWFAEWMKAATAFWGPLASMGAATDRSDDKKTASKKKEKSRAEESWEMMLKTMEALSSAMYEPETMGAAFKGTSELPQILIKVDQTGRDSFLNFQQRWLERVGKFGESTSPYTFESLDEDPFKPWIELYEKEFRQFANLPQLGLARFYQEKMNRAIDTFNIFQSQMAKFTHLLYLPVEKSFLVLQEKLSELADQGELPEDSKTYYQMWIKILEGHYMTLFQSPEYIEALSQTLDSFANFSSARREILQDYLKMFPIPTQKEMDELYKEIYLLKKRIRKLEKGK